MHSSSSTSSSSLFDRLTEDFERARALGSINWEAYIPTLLLIVAGLALFYFARRRQSVYRVGLITCGAILILRAALFHTPVTWYVFFKMYESEEIGFRERNMVAANIDKYFLRSDRTQYLVIGSSQSRMFKDVATEHRDFSLYSFAGLQPIEYPLWEGLIESRNPRNVILYISEFDLARESTPSALELDPLPAKRIPWLYDNLSAQHGSAAAIATMKRMVVGDLLPEYRFGYLFRALTTRWFGAPSANQSVPSMTPEEWAYAQAIGLRSKLHEKYIGINAPLLEQFVADCVARGSNVYIFEGQYHPVAYDDNLRQLRRESNAALSAMAGRNRNVRFIPIEAQPALTSADFVDGYHLSPETSRRFAMALFSQVQGS
jgi:hypothetical protein